jgi:hypothetical protein
MDVGLVGPCSLVYDLSCTLPCIPSLRWAKGWRQIDLSTQESRNDNGKHQDAI